MADPVIDSASMDKSSYADGETMVLTVSRSDPDSESYDLTITARNPASGAESAPVTVTIAIDATELVFTDPTGRVWTKQSDNGTVAVFTAVA